MTSFSKTIDLNYDSYKKNFVLFLSFTHYVFIVYTFNSVWAIQCQ